MVRRVYLSIAASISAENVPSSPGTKNVGMSRGVLHNDCVRYVLVIQCATKSQSRFESTTKYNIIILA